MFCANPWASRDSSDLPCSVEKSSEERAEDGGARIAPLTPTKEDIADAVAHS